MNQMRGTYRPTRREDYAPIVKGLLPLCEGEELKLRSSLMLLRDRALSTKAHAVDDMSASAWALLEIIIREADEAALQGMPLEALTEFRALCMECALLAQRFERLYQPQGVEG